MLLPLQTPAPALPAPAASTAAAPDLLPGFRRAAHFGERVREGWLEGGVRVLLNAPATVDPAKPTRLVVYATPNGNTIEQTLGSAVAPGTDWHFDIQHVAAQGRRLREVAPDANIVLAVVEAEGLSWPAWRARTPDNAARIVRVVEALRAQTPGANVRVTLAGHSGGGSFLFGFLNAAEAVPGWVERIAFLDANYSYSDRDRHGDKLLAWLKSDPDRRLFVLAYDDREITLDGKKVVGPDGGTYRATARMRERFARDGAATEAKSGPFVTFTAAGGQAVFRVHTNPENKILHTALVGEMNGLLEALTLGGTSRERSWGTFGGPRAYREWVQPAAGIPPRPKNAEGGRAFLERIAKLSPEAREEAIADALCAGNLPDFLRTFATVTLTAAGPDGKPHTATVAAMPDYLAVGSDADFVRVPMTPMTAQRVADAFGCALPTRRLVDALHAAATVRLDPQPLTEAREAPATFARHNALIEAQRARAGKPLGALVSGVKKDVVVTNRLGERPNRVAIYGWHRSDGGPIQPLTIVHRDTYVDYSHGVRLIRREVMVDGRPRDVRHVLHAADLCALLSDEGPLRFPAY
jgi:hypothetical protein